MIIEHDHSIYEWNADRNDNGSFFCYDCRCGGDNRLGCIVVLFDADTHEHWKLIENPYWSDLADAYQLNPEPV